MVVAGLVAGGLVVGAAVVGGTVLDAWRGALGGAAAPSPLEPLDGSAQPASASTAISPVAASAGSRDPVAWRRNRCPDRMVMPLLT